METIEKTNDEKSNDTGKIIVAALVGVVIGGALGVLFAPAKGSETRKKLMANGEQLKDTLLGKFGDLMDPSHKEDEDEKIKEDAPSKNGSIAS